MKQSQKNIQIVKVQVGDLRKKRKAKKKGKGKSKTIVGTGQAPVLGQTQFSYPTAPMASRPGYQFEPPKQQVLEPIQIADLVLSRIKEEQQKRFENAMRQGSSKPSEEERMAERLRALSKAPEEWSVSSSSSGVRLEEPSKPLERPRSPLVSAEAASSSSQQYTRQYLRSLTFSELSKIAKELGLRLPDAGSGAKERLVEIIFSYKPLR